jgi:TatD DNase family protein
MLVDSHAHLQWGSFDKDREDVIRRARKAGVEQIINIGFDIGGSRRAVELTEKYEGLYATVGIHPHNASQLNQETLNELRRLSQRRRVVAIGEIGLDYYRNLSPRETQKKAFEAQLLLAEELRLPVVIHDREAHTEIWEMLSKFKGRIHGIMHCFSESKEMAEQYIEMNFYVSLAGSVTFPNSHRLHEIAKSIDLKKLLLETDCPWLAPQDVRGRRNEPAFLTFTAKKIAELKEIPLGEVVEATTKNAKRIFQIP